MSEFLASTDNQNFTEINKFKRNELRVREREILQAWCPFHTLSVIYILTDRRPGDVRLQGHSRVILLSEVGRVWHMEF